MRSLVTTTALLAVLAALTSPAAAPAAVRPADARGPLANERLSNETTVTRWAHTARRAAVRSAPRRSARRVATLRFWTEDKRPEVYLALSSRRAGGQAWVRIRVPGRPNGRTGWVPESALGALHVVRTRFVLDHRTLRATLDPNIPSAPTKVCVNEDLSKCSPARGSRIWGSRRGERIAGTAGPNRIRAGGGNDRILVRRGWRDVVRCGRGRDVVRAGARDRVASDCEVVRIRGRR